MRHQAPEIVAVKKENPLWSRDHDGNGLTSGMSDMPVNIRESAIVERCGARRDR